PEIKHYENELLDCCYLYTFDEKYKEVVKEGIENSYETTRLYLKNIAKDFRITKELRDKDYDGIGLRDIYKNIYNFLINKYKLTQSKKRNREILETNGFIIGNQVYGRYMQGRFITFKDVTKSEEYKGISYTVNTHDHGLSLLHSIDNVKRAVSMTSENVRAVFKRLYASTPGNKDKILSLNIHEWYAFIINNVDKLKEDFREVAASTEYQVSFKELNPKTEMFKLPLEDKYKYDPNESLKEHFEKFTYDKYTTQMTVSGLRSVSEQLFEQYCESND